MIELFARHGDAIQRRRVSLLVHAMIDPRYETIQELLPKAFGFSHKDHIGMSAGLLRQQRHMRAAHHHARSSRPEPRRKTIGVISTRRVKGNAYDIRLIGPVDVFGLFIDVSYLPIGRNPGGQIRHGNLLEIKEPGPSRSANFIRGCGNQEEFRHSRLELARWVSRNEPSSPICLAYLASQSRIFLPAYPLPEVSSESSAIRKLSAHSTATDMQP